MLKSTSPLQIILDSLVKALSQTSQNQFVLHFKPGKEEKFSSFYRGGELHLEAEGPLAAVYGLHYLSFGINSPYFPEFIGPKQPRCPMRILAMEATQRFSIASDLAIDLPDIRKEWWERTCYKTLELGYNSFLFRTNNLSPSSCCYEEISSIFECIHSYGLKIILEPHIELSSYCPIDPKSKEKISSLLKQLMQLFPTIDSLFWEERALSQESLDHPLAQTITQQEMAQKEIALFEEILKQTPLIYFVRSRGKRRAEQQVQWLPKLMNQTGQKTTIAFSAHQGDPWDDHAERHPLWNGLRRLQNNSTTALLPIVNIGSVKQGGGLWPSLSLDLIDCHLTRCYRHSFVGAIVLLNRLPERGSFLEGTLWSASQYLWEEKAADLLLETWFLARRPELSYMKMAKPLKRLRALVIALSRMRAEPPTSIMRGRVEADALLAELSDLQHIFEGEGRAMRKLGGKLNWNDYFLPFARDARRIIYHWMQKHQITLPHYRKEEDEGEGFWTKTGSSSDLFLARPNSGVLGSSMHAIYKENGYE